MVKFRFHDMEIWQHAIEISDSLYDISNQLAENNYYRFAEQLRAAAMSISNNIAEGSGSSSNKEFAYFLNIAHRSAFEVSSILESLKRLNRIDTATYKRLNYELDLLCRRITTFKRSLFR